MANVTESAIRRFKEHYGTIDRKSVMDFFGLKKDGYKELIRKVHHNMVQEVAEEIKNDM